MAQDLRQLFKENNTPEPSVLPKNHKRRFEVRLEKQFPSQQKTAHKFYYVKIAAVLLVAFFVGILGFWLTQNSVTTQNTPSVVNSSNKLKTTEKPVLLSDVSSEFKKVEDYYIGNINAELADLKVTDENKNLIEAYLEQLTALDKEYKSLNQELASSGVIDEMSINALMNNLKLRLNLLHKLKNKLKELKAPVVSIQNENQA
ncbi:hypothetical protein GGR32_001994 [Mesonia hippocampi]|uniref:Anti-sigma factor n=1 Tax=Mesonia hippocampi TaxID=1628250 RepID=A0A840ENJ0_9FLAO|nr:hypothetical protein [Mesonia hippocampi]MBB4119688.1 hypothetical protein [Mesonia hippocampi]